MKKDRNEQLCTEISTLPLWYDMIGRRVWNMAFAERSVKARADEELIDRRNHGGVKDLTSCNAVLQIKTNGKAEIVLR